MKQWNSLFCILDPSDNPTECLQQTIERLDYDLYSAFDLIPGKSFPDTLKTFVVPSHGQWTQILVDTVTDNDNLQLLAEALSAYGLCLLTLLDTDSAVVEAYANGEEVDVEPALSSHLMTGKTVDDLRFALLGQLPLPMIEMPKDEQSQILAIEDLPDDMRQLTQGINVPSAQKMFKRFTSKLLGRQDVEGAQQLLDDETLDWNSAGGMIIRGVLSCMIAGDAWLSPDFAAVREAYQRHIRLQRRPNAKLYPGDQQMMNAVPNALDYTPVYGGQE